MSTIRTLVSLGSICFSSQWIKDNNYKLESYPFDWIVSNIKMCIHCINDDFRTFLDRNNHYLIYSRPIRSGHTIYDTYVQKNIFPHHNIKEQYDYYSRCVNRFINLYNNMDHKLFILFSHYNSSLEEDIITELNTLNSLLKTKTSNFYILYIHSYNAESSISHELEINDNLYIVKFKPTSFSNGRVFENKSDMDYLYHLIHSMFKFDIK